MIQRLYIHNYKTFQNFELNATELHSLLILGKNGTGKSNLLEVMSIFQSIGKNKTALEDLIQANDFGFFNQSSPIVLELEAKTKGQVFIYHLEIVYPENFFKPKIETEKLKVDGNVIFDRSNGKLNLKSSNSEFTLDWHHISLPLILIKDEQDPIFILKNYLSNIIVLGAIPSQFYKLSRQENPFLNRDGSNILDWMRFHLGQKPYLYSQMIHSLKFRMPDLIQFRFEQVGKEERELIVEFEERNERFLINFNFLSDGEKIFFLAAVLLAVVSQEIDILCFWDEPDAFISLPELNHFITTCRKTFENSKLGSQLIVTSHKQGTINQFSEHNIFVFSRSSHLVPTRIKIIRDFDYLSPTLEEAYENGELEWR